MLYTQLKAEYSARRARLRGLLEQAGLPPLLVEGSYFVSYDISTLGHQNDQEFCRWLIREIGVAAIPTSIFYSNQANAPQIVRFCFAKQDATLVAAGERLSRVRNQAISR